MSIFRQLPSPEVDAAWQHVSTLGQVFLTTEEVIKLGKDPTMAVRANDQPDKHIGLVNGFHEIHCLNMLRQNLHRDYYWPEGVESPYQWIHVYHCLYIILQSLTCDVNTDIATYNWVETRQDPVWDFSVNRVCRDFDALLEWHNRTTRPIDDYSFRRIGGEKELPVPEQLKRIQAHGPSPRVGIKTDPALLGSFEAWY
ncbi:hypothetical protein N7448_006708 [Penicillium atrosanguineum]|uniref:Tat pathway signal sequence protein n=1 Tax=Penicillium atrosanguineum TaxID=1132637 RepID=A0A9W9PSB7_9EURO|nr:uncharacterized protein N7443_010469 [Penicillium atrosanguineum]KAJ5132550.1 hypothetical protein N7448_006708 [Penicillium atrosanguineum]KAJ5137236.1 hypothetical protein N7526_003469 [Penicillium atrosanguineum]KAJ5290216.1 hypothetical protein N7443_010469 [Penicillium atrosanguineum]KAJ5308040.1 hypothetical protein N7476_008696 [Penicillium atrosanguineum]